MTMCDEFEAHMLAAGLSICVRLTDGDYFNPRTQADWQLWQAATETAAKKCDAQSDHAEQMRKASNHFFSPAALVTKGGAMTARILAAAIRGKGE